MHFLVSLFCECNESVAYIKSNIKYLIFVRGEELVFTGELLKRDHAEVLKQKSKECSRRGHHCRLLFQSVYT